MTQSWPWAECTLAAASLQSTFAYASSGSGFRRGRAQGRHRKLGCGDKLDASWKAQGSIQHASVPEMRMGWILVSFVRARFGLSDIGKSPSVCWPGQARDARRPLINNRDAGRVGQHVTGDLILPGEPDFLLSLRVGEEVVEASRGAPIDPALPRVHVPATLADAKQPRSSRRSLWDETPETGDLHSAPRWSHSCVLPEIAPGRD